MRTIASALALLLGLLAAGCNGELVGGGQRPSRLEVVSGDLQSATVGEELAQPLVVRVVDDRDRPIRNQLVNFVVTAGGGRVFAGSALTNAQGEARERWTLGTVAGDTQRVEARAVDPATGQPLVFAVFRAVATPGAPHTVTSLSAGVRVGSAGTALADSLAARVTDTYGNAVPGATVVWGVSAGGGAVSPAQSITDAQGVARTAWTLGARVDGTQTAEASISPAVRASFTATAGLPIGSALHKVSGDGQNAAVGAQLATPIAVRLVLPDGRPVQGASVVWSVNNGPGSGGVDRPVAITDADGRAEVRWTLGTAAGTQTLLPTVGTVSAMFTATATAGAPATLALVGGDGQTGAAGGALAEQLAVRVMDAHGNPVGGAQVLWGVLAGGGNVTAQSTAGADGVARATWTLGMRVDAAQRAEATIAGLRVEFTAMPGIPSSAELAVVSGGGQSATVGTALASPVVVMLRLADGRGIAGAPVTFSAMPNSGSLTPASAVTDANGRVQATWTLGQQAGAASATAGAPGVASITLSATATSGAPASLVLVSGGGQTGAVGAPLPETVAVRALDAFGNPVPGAQVSWAVLRGGGGVAAAQSGGDGPGVARVEWTLGLRVDSAQVLEAVVAPGIRVEVTATPGIPSSAALSVESGNGQSATVGTALASPLIVRLRLADGRGIIGAPVTFSASPNAGSFTPATVVTDANGRVQATWTLGQQAGAATGTASAPGVASVALSATATSGAPAAIAVVSGSGQSGSANMPLAAPLVVKVTDGLGNPVPGVAVTWTSNMTSTFAPAQSTTNAQGLAQTTWTPARGGSPTATATIAGGFTAVFNATVAWNPASITISPATGTLLVGDSVVVSATAYDANGGVLTGAPISLTVPSGSPLSITPQGLVRATSYAAAGGKVIASLEGKADTVTFTVRRPRYEELDASGGCAIDADDRVMCPGYSSELPLGLLRARDFTSMPQVCAVTFTGGYACWSAEQGLRVVANSLGLTQLDGRCGIDAAGQAYCSGRNVTGEVGDGTSRDRNTRETSPLTAVVGNHTFESISASGAFTCALNSSGLAYCWGYNDMGQLGSTAATSTCHPFLSESGPCSLVPLQTAGGRAYTQIATGDEHACAVTSGGAVYCWGLNTSGQLGTGSTSGPNLCTPYNGEPGDIPCATSPVLVQAGGVQFQQVEAFGKTTCGLATDGRAFCWGFGEQGQLGNGSTSSSSVPVLVAGGHTFKDIGGGPGSAGTYAAGLTTDGRLFRWGGGATTPTQVPGQI